MPRLGESPGGQAARPPLTPPRIGVLLNRRDHFQRGLLQGVLQSNLAEHLHRYDSLVRDYAQLKPESFDGMIGCFYDCDLAARLREVGLPAVNLSSSVPDIDLPAVLADNVAAGAAAAEHLLERGFWQFGYVGFGSRLFSMHRSQGFTRAVTQRGHRVIELDLNTLADAQDFATDAGDASGERDAKLRAWVRALPRPVGVLCMSDEVGQRVLGACRSAGLAVPEEVAVMGVDDDPTVCAFYPGLTSVALPLERMGLLAAQRLSAMMTGDGQDREPGGGGGEGGVVQLPPAGVTVRGSTDIVASGDPHVARALRYIRQHACDGIKVNDVMDVVPISRREFEKQCKTLLGRTPLEQIHHVRMNQARRLLTQTDLSIGEVSHRCGFKNVHYLGRWFGKLTGMTPSEFRAQHRTRGEA